MKFRRLIPLILCSFTLLSCQNKYVNDNQDVCLSIVEGEHFDVTSENPLKVKKGTPAKFNLAFDQGYFFADATLGEYDDGILTINNPTKSQSIVVRTRLDGEFTLQVINDSSKGNFTITPNKSAFKKGEEVTIKVTPNVGYKALCYSENYPSYSEDIDDPIALANAYGDTYKFKMDHNMKIYTNYFRMNNDSVLIKYDLNGGVTNEGLEIIEQEFNIKKPHFNPTSMMGSYYMHKSGYILESYNTHKDGSGIRIGIGSKIDISLFNKKEITLYAQWAKESDASNFEFALQDDAYSIKKYKGNEETIVVPATYNDKKVTMIANGAFQDLNVKKLVLSPNMEIVSLNAFYRCFNLKELIMYSNIKDIENDSFNPNVIEKVRLNCNTYTDLRKSAEKDISYQLEAIDHLKKDKRMIFVGTSTLRFNQTMELIKENHPEYDYYLYGAVVRTDMALMLDLLKTHLNENDKVLYMIHEFSNYIRYADLRNIMFLEFNFDLLADLNYQDHKDILFKSLIHYNTIALQGFGKKAVISEAGCEDVNDYGKANRINYPTDDPNNVGDGDPFDLQGYCNERFYKFLLPFIDKLPVLSINKYGLWSSYNKNAVNDDSHLDMFETFIRNMFSSLTFVDSIYDNVFEGINFAYKDNMHMVEKYTYIREQHWLKVLPF